MNKETVALVLVLVVAFLFCLSWVILNIQDKEVKESSSVPKWLINQALNASSKPANACLEKGYTGEFNDTEVYQCLWNLLE